MYNKDLERIRQINRLYEIDENLTQFKMKKYKAYGEGNNRFYFVSASNKEHPVEYAKRIIVESVNKSRLKGFDKKSTSEIFKIYATTQLLLDNLKDSIQLSYVFETINNLKELKREKVQKVIYVHDGEYSDLHKTSPGMQTNAIMEYILHCESTIPLFMINRKIILTMKQDMTQLTKWIRKQSINVKYSCYA